ncbi:MAG: polysaccharide deacetylase family protein, partial [Propionivibrio sp.]
GSVTSSGLWKLGLFAMIKPRVTVLLYHRVSDDARDNLTTGIEQFDRQMSLLRGHCEVLSVEEVLMLKRIPKTKHPLVCVTFDDGYLDNFTNAAQILLRHEIPAAFFVSTGLIGTSRVFPHDVRRGNQAIPMMNWDHLRAMHSDGFTIGSHTVTHIDCAGEPEDVVKHELMQSRDDLVRELKLKSILFGYPYGGRQHMTQQRLELVKQAGFVGCLSAYGGTNIGTVDPFDVRRRGIHWEYSDDSFIFECFGLR